MFLASNHEGLALKTDMLYRLSAFADIASDSPLTGNPAGVWIGDCLPDTATMQRIASDVGYSETAFLAPAIGLQRQVKYFSPLAEVPFCGHATIAAAVALGKVNGTGDYATGSAAAAFGGYLRNADLIQTPRRLTIRQGEKMGRPSVIMVDIPVKGGIHVTGTAVAID